MLNSYSNCIAQLNNCIKHRWSFVQIKGNKFVIKLLQAFYAYKIIDGYYFNLQEKMTKNCTIYLKYYKGYSLIQKINIFHLPGNNYFLKKKKIIKKMKKNPRDIFFISTKNGIKGYRYTEMSKKSIEGGLLLCSVITL